MIGQVREALELEGTETNFSMLKQRRAALEEKIELLRHLDEEILTEDNFTEEIEQADTYRGKLQLAIIDIDAAILSATPPPEPYGAGSEMRRRSTSIHSEDHRSSHAHGGEPLTRESSPTSSLTGSIPSSPAGHRGP
jgi:hypothetical protein